MSFLQYIEGIVVHKSEKSITLSVGPLGLEVVMPLDETVVIGSNLKIITHLSWNAENGPTLFGFSSVAQRDFFLLIIESPGIGPKLALTILNTLSLPTLINGLLKEDQALFSGVSGIGAKKASVLFLELKHKLSSFLRKHPQQRSQKDQATIDWNMLSQVLVSLQYKRPEINAALMYVQSNVDIPMTFDSALKSALQFLTQRQ